MCSNQLRLEPVELYKIGLLGPEVLERFLTTGSNFTDTSLLQPTNLIFNPIDTTITGVANNGYASQFHMQQGYSIEAPTITAEEIEGLMGWPVTGFTFPGLSPGEQCDSTSDNDDSPPLPTLNITQLSGSLAVHALSPSTSSIESEKVRDKRPIRYKKDKNRNPAQRKAHNAIEKRYRENLKTKFAALERATCGITGFSSVPLRKSTILSNAILHIEEMEDKNKKLEKELKALRKRVGSSPLEIL